MRKTIGWAAALIVVGLLAGCGSGNGNGGNEGSGGTAKTAGADGGTSEASGGASGPDSGPVTKIIVGTGTQFPQVCFLDENGKLTGYDVELVREIDKRLPQYEFNLQTFDFANLLLSLETKKIDFVAHEMEKNPEREEKYLFNKEPYAHWQNKIVVAKSNKDADSIKTLDDLVGKKVITGATSAEAQILENYNKSHNGKIDIVYQSGAANDTVSQLVSGRAYATIAADFTLSLIDPQGELTTAGEPLSDAEILFVFRKDDPDDRKLADAIDGAIKAIKDDGTLSELSKTWLGQDYTTAG